MDESGTNGLEGCLALVWSENVSERARIRGLTFRDSQFGAPRSVAHVDRQTDGLGAFDQSETCLLPTLQKNKRCPSHNRARRVTSIDGGTRIRTPAFIRG